MYSNNIKIEIGINFGNTNIRVVYNNNLMRKTVVNGFPPLEGSMLARSSIWWTYLTLSDLTTTLV